MDSRDTARQRGAHPVRPHHQSVSHRTGHFSFQHGVHQAGANRYQLLACTERQLAHRTHLVQALHAAGNGDRGRDRSGWQQRSSRTCLRSRHGSRARRMCAIANESATTSTSATAGAAGASSSRRSNSRCCRVSTSTERRWLSDCWRLSSSSQRPRRSVEGPQEAAHDVSELDGLGPGAQALHLHGRVAPCVALVL
jgi:hypothetical protein